MPPSSSSLPSSSTPNVSQVQATPQVEHYDDVQAKDEQEKPNSLLDANSFVFDPTYIQNGYKSQENADIEFQKELANQLCALLLQYHAWSAARPEVERQNAVNNLNTAYNEIVQREQEQENTRLQYAELLRKVRILVATVF